MAERGDPRDPTYKGTIYEQQLRARYKRCSSYVQNRRVLDAPCGTGWGASTLQGVASLTGIDINTGATAFGKSEFPSIQFAAGTMAALPFRDAAFEVVLCLDGLEHLYRSDAPAFIKEAWRTLGPGGLFIATVPLLNRGRHSGNPYHLFEYTESSILRLLNTCFETAEHEVLEVPGGPIIWFVGKRLPAPLEQGWEERGLDQLAARGLGWLDSVRIDGGFCYAPGQPKTLASTCLAVLLLESAGALPAIEPAERAEWTRYIQSCQAAGTGLFHDPAVDITASPSHDAEYFAWQTTYLAIQALDALGASAAAPLRFIDRFTPPNAVETWLDGLDWHDPWLQSNRVMFLLAAIIYQVERERQTDQAALYHRILDWLERSQNPRTGLWGAGEDAPLLNAVAGAYHFLPFYEYVHRPISGIHQIVDRALELQQPDGLFAAAVGGGACEDLDAVDILTLAVRHTSHRSDEIKRALIRAYWAAWNLQNEDGSFPYARSGAGKTYSFGGCSALTAGVGSGDVWSTWFRLLLLATVAAQFPADAPACQWTFRRWPALGYHRYGPELSAAESSVLPLWIRRAEIQPAPGPAVVTVVVTCYNLGVYLHEAITSALQQTLQPVRVILVDDGSTDPFTKFLLDLMPWQGVELIRQENKGVAAARNTAIEMASTSYICCLDGDDRLRPEYLAKAVEALGSDSKLGFVSCYYRLFDCEEGTYRYTGCRLPNMLVRNEAVGVSVFRKDAWRRAGGYCETLSGMHDWDLWIGILEAGYQAAAIPEVLFDYRIRPQSMYSVTRRPENFQRLVGTIVSRHVTAYRQYVADIIPLQARQFSELVEFHRGQIANRDRDVAGLRAELARERGVSEERHAWIESLEEAKRWFLEQLAAGEQAKGIHDQQASAEAGRAANPAKEGEPLLDAGPETGSGRLRQVEAQLAELQEWAQQLQEAARYHERQASEMERQLTSIRSSLTWRAAERVFRWVRGLHGIVFGAGMLCSAASGQRRRNLLFWAKAYANESSRQILRQQYQSDFYLARYSDVAASGVPGLLHYICAGYLEDRNPSGTFDQRYYVNRYPDVAASRIPPLLHYALFGAREGRFPSRRMILPESARRDWAAALPPERVRLDNTWPPGEPLVSVVIPCFNYGAYVEGAIQSVLQQTFPNYEIIVIEGGSTDGVTPQRLKELEKAYPGVRFLFRPERHLLGDNRNYGIAHARGRYVCYLDADDLFRPTYLEVAAFLLERYGYDIVYPSLRCFGDSTMTWFPGDASFPEIAAENQVSVVALFRKTAWETAGPFRDWGTGSDYVYEDWDFWVRALGRGFRAKAIREPLMLYRVHNASLSAGSRDRNDNERHRLAIAEANRDLLAAPLCSPREVTVTNAWTNLGALPAPQPPTILLALPFISVGGAEKHFFMLVQGLVARGYRVVIVTTIVLPETVPADNELFDSLTRFVYNLPALFPDHSCWPEFIRYLLRRYHAGAIVIAGCEFVYHLLPELRREFPNIRIIDQLFNDTGHIVNNRRYAHLIDLNIVPSRLLADALMQKHGADPRKVVAIQNGANIDVPAYRSRAEAVAAAGLPAEGADKFLVSFLGRLSEEKAPRAFVEIARRLASRKDMYFCIAGDGPERAAVLKAIAAYGLETRLFYAGLLRDVRPLLAASNVVVVPSTLDGMPQIVVEAQLFAKPVVASAVGSLPDMIENGVTGFVCPAGDIAAFCARIRQLQADPELCRMMGERARAAAAARYDLDKMVQAYVDAIGLPSHSPANDSDPSTNALRSAGAG